MGQGARFVALHVTERFQGFQKKAPLQSEPPGKGRSAICSTVPQQRALFSPAKSLPLQSEPLLADPERDLLPCSSQRVLRLLQRGAAKSLRLTNLPLPCPVWHDGCVWWWHLKT